MFDERKNSIPEELINKLPNLKLVITSGMWNASVDAETLKKKKYYLLWN